MQNGTSRLRKLGRAVVDWIRRGFLRFPAVVVPTVAARPLPGASHDFLLGANLPWLEYGGDFGANNWHPRGGLASGDRLKVLGETLSTLTQHGVRVVRWFMLCDGRAGIRFAGDGTPVSLDDYFFADIDAALAVARDHNVTILFALLDFHWCKPRLDVNGVQTQGRRDVLRDRDKRRKLLDLIVTPILIRYGRSPVILGWDIINEPEWVTFAVGGGWRPKATVMPSMMRGFIAEGVDLVHRHTSQAATVGLASTRGLDLCRGLGLDFYQVHWYDPLESQSPLERRVSEFRLDRPILLGEFPTKGSRRTVSELFDSAHRAGYAGAFFWSALATDDFSDCASAQVGLARWNALQEDSTRRA